MATMFEQLMNLPLFRGISQTRMSTIVGNTKLHFLKYPANETLVRAGDPCTHLTFILAGSVRLTTVNANGRFAVGQTLNAPAVLSPDFLFGRHTNYPCTAVAIDDVSVVKIAKQDYTTLLQSDPVFLFNYINMIAANAQKSVEGIMSLTTGEIDERIAFWISALTQFGSTDIVLTCRKRDLYSLFGVQRSVFESGLEKMREKGLIEYNNSELSVVDRQRLLAILEHNHEAGHDDTI